MPNSCNCKYSRWQQTWTLAIVAYLAAGHKREDMLILLNALVDVLEKVVNIFK